MRLLARHAVWLSFLILAGVFVVFPEIDLTVSGWFYNPETGEWAGKHHPLADAIYGLFRYLPFFLLPVLLATVAGSFLPGSGLKSSRRVWVFLLITLLAGPGILVHSIMKEGFDRARPKNVEQFDGHKTFTPAFVISSHCDRGCNSFVSGHAAMGFWFMTLGWVFSSYRWFATGLVLGGVLSVTRLVQGGHFLSDTLFAGYLCFFTFQLASWVVFRRFRVVDQ